MDQSNQAKTILELFNQKFVSYYPIYAQITGSVTATDNDGDNLIFIY